MPAPAVIPAPQAYTNVAVVKTFVVNVSVNPNRIGRVNCSFEGKLSRLWERETVQARSSCLWAGPLGEMRSTTVNKSACSRQALGGILLLTCLNDLAWNCNNLAFTGQCCGIGNRRRAQVF